MVWDSLGLYFFRIEYQVKLGDVIRLTNTCNCKTFCLFHMLIITYFLKV